MQLDNQKHKTETIPASLVQRRRVVFGIYLTNLSSCPSSVQVRQFSVVQLPTQGVGLRSSPHLALPRHLSVPDGYRSPHGGSRSGN